MAYPGDRECPRAAAIRRHPRTSRPTPLPTCAWLGPTRPRPPAALPSRPQSPAKPPRVAARSRARRRAPPGGRSPVALFAPPRHAGSRGRATRPAPCSIARADAPSSPGLAPALRAPFPLPRSPSPAAVPPGTSHPGPLGQLGEPSYPRRSPAPAHFLAERVLPRSLRPAAGRHRLATLAQEAQPRLALALGRQQLATAQLCAAKTPRVPEPRVVWHPLPGRHIYIRLLVLLIPGGQAIGGPPSLLLAAQFHRHVEMLRPQLHATDLELLLR